MTDIPWGTEYVALWKRSSLDRCLFAAVPWTQVVHPGCVTPEAKEWMKSETFELCHVFLGWKCEECKTTFIVSSCEDLRHSPCCP